MSCPRSNATEAGVNESYPCSSGLLLPLLNESEWKPGVRAVLYLVGLLYSFLGVAVYAEAFMCAIERITSSIRKVKLKPGEVPDGEGGSIDTEYKRVLVWNPTVANLTLMALGSSAPEILLSIIEIVGKDFHAGELGPGTIVGSAAFNLLAITAICIMCVDSPKRIENITVFIVTTCFSAFAYLWLLIILRGPSKDEVEIWEATLTLLFFVALIAIAYMADIRLFDRYLKRRRDKTLAQQTPLDVTIRPTDPEKIKDEDVLQPLQDASKTPDDFMVVWRDPNAPESEYHPEWRHIERDSAKEYPDLPPEDLAKLVAYRINQEIPHNRLWYRILGIKRMTSSIKRKEYFEPGAREEQEGLAPSVSMVSLPQGTLVVRGKRVMTIEFMARVYVVDPTEQDRVRLRVVRRGRTHKKVMFRYETLNGLGKRNVHYLHKAETLVFQPGETEKVFSVDLVNANEWNDGDMFYVKLELDPTVTDKRIKIGRASPAEIVYLPQEPDKVSVGFLQNHTVCRENDGFVRLPIVRFGSVKDEVSVEWYTEDISAHHGQDYEGGRGEILFAEGEREKYLDLGIIDDVEVEKTEYFSVNLSSCSHGSLGSNSRALVTILNDDKTSKFLTTLDGLVPKTLENLEFTRTSWIGQIMRASTVNDGDVANATLFDCIMHIISFPWKVTAALIPPPSLWGGWAAFLVALIMIGALTAVIGDLASIFGCLVGLSDSVTAITFVAMGTSLPDTFASKLAAQMDRSADNAIGNVTGSNSVNVFLGLGLPWFIASIVWAVRGKPFKVPSGTIGFSVTIYTICSIVCIALLFARRKLAIFGRAELGGPLTFKWISAIILLVLWFLYILLSALQAQCTISGF